MSAPTWASFPVPGTTFGKAIHLLYFPPYHSKHNPIERCWGVLEQAWNGTLLTDVETMLDWAGGMTWKGLKSVIELSGRDFDPGADPPADFDPSVDPEPQFDTDQSLAW